MDRKKIIYIGSILLVTVFVSVTYFSYAFFTSKNEYHGKVNMVVGTLDYKLSSSLLNNNSITLAANEKARLNIEVKSLNEINSKYELYYTTTNNNIEIGYNTANDLPTGTINAKAKKTVTVIIKNPSNSNATITFGVQGGFTHNNLTLETGKTSLTQIQSSYCDIAVNNVYNYDYTGDSQEFETPCSGNYKLETWGAQGGSVDGKTNYNKSYGGYSTGLININKSNNLYITVGGKGTSIGDNNTILDNNNGYNGGGQNSSQEQTVYYGSGGGGATHISNSLIDDGLLKNYSNNISNLLIVSGGGGGSSTSSTSKNNVTTDGQGGSGGGFVGVNGTTTYEGQDIRTPGAGGTQSAGGISEPEIIRANINNSNLQSQASFGMGAVPYSSYSSYMRVAGGGGFYGGGGGVHSGGGGGSGYIGNSNLTSKAMYCYECEENGNANTYTVSTYGTTTHASERDTTNCPNGYSSNPVSKCAKAGNGYAKITFVSESTKEEKTSMTYEVKLDANGGTVSSEVISVVRGKTYGNLPTPTREGYTFDGWYTDKELGEKITNNSTVTIDYNKTLYARWTYDIYNLGPVVNVNSNSTENGEYFGSLYSTKLYTGPVDGTGANYTDNNGNLVYDANGALLLDSNNAIPVLDIDQSYNIGDRYSVAMTVYGNIYQTNGHWTTLEAISGANKNYLTVVNFNGGYLNVHSYYYGNGQVKQEDYTIDGFTSLDISEYDGEIMNIQVTGERGGKTRIYINGVLKREFNSGNAELSHAYLTIGDLRVGRNLKFTGKVYDFAIFDKVLTAEQVSNNYQISVQQNYQK